jgi:hypothetical protein
MELRLTRSKPRWRESPRSHCRIVAPSGARDRHGRWIFKLQRLRERLSDGEPQELQLRRQAHRPDAQNASLFPYRSYYDFEPRAVAVRSCLRRLAAKRKPLEGNVTRVLTLLARGQSAARNLCDNSVPLERRRRANSASPSINEKVLLSTRLACSPRLGPLPPAMSRARQTIVGIFRPAAPATRGREFDADAASKLACHFPNRHSMRLVVKTTGWKASGDEIKHPLIQLIRLILFVAR